MTKLPTLYKRTATGALQEWTVFAENGFYWTEFGQTGGAIQTSERVACEPKNVGRANETTAAQQAELEAKALHTKKLRKDYCLDPNVKAGQTSELIEGGLLPMLAHKFSEHGDKLKYPCFVQAKYDGHRCIATHPGGGEQSYQLWSRTRKPICSVPHIVHALDWLECGGLPFDGELFNYDYRDKFEQLTHFIRQSKPEAGCEVVQYHIYDMPIGGTFRQRLATMQRILGKLTTGSPLRLAETREVNDEDELMLAFEEFLAAGQEGAIARNADGLYVNKRSTDLLKIKQFDDAEFRVLAVKEGRGKMQGHAVFVVESRLGTTTDAKLKGELSTLRQYWEHPEMAVGRMLTCQFQGYTKAGKLRFPVALRFAQPI